MNSQSKFNFRVPHWKWTIALPVTILLITIVLSFPFGNPKWSKYHYWLQKEMNSGEPPTPPSGYTGIWRKWKPECCFQQGQCKYVTNVREGSKGRLFVHLFCKARSRSLGFEDISLASESYYNNGNIIHGQRVSIYTPRVIRLTGSWREISTTYQASKSSKLLYFKFKNGKWEILRTLKWGQTLADARMDNSSDQTGFLATEGIQ